jgi:hypothetical protein
MPDIIVAKMFREAQARAGVPDLDDLHDKRRTIIETHGELMALHRNKSLLDGKRKETLALCALEVRDRFETEGKKVTEARVDDEAHVHPRYRQWLSDTIVDGAKALMYENIVNECNELIKRGDSAMYQYSSEPK